MWMGLGVLASHFVRGHGDRGWGTPPQSGSLCPDMSPWDDVSLPLAALSFQAHPLTREGKGWGRGASRLARPGDWVGEEWACRVANKGPVTWLFWWGALSLAHTNAPLPCEAPGTEGTR